MSLQLESGMRDAIGVLGYDIVTNCAKQIGAEGHDVPTRVSGFHVGMLVMMVGYCEPNAVTRASVCEAGLMKNLVSKSGNRGGRMIDGRGKRRRGSESSFWLQPRGLLVPQEVIFI